MVTVVIPCYNYGNYLAQAILSVLQQELVIAKCIVVNDGSTDQTELIAKSFGSKIRYIAQEHRGVSAARNYGLQYVETPFVLFLDADDFLQPYALHRLLQVIEEKGNSFAVVGYHYHLVDESGNILNHRVYQKLEGREYTSRDFLIKNRFPCCALIRTEVLKTCGGFDESLISSEDRDVWIRIGLQHRIWFHPEPLVNIRKHSRNMSKNGEVMLHNIFQVIQKNCIKENGFSCLLYRKALAFAYYQGAWMAIGNRSSWKVILYLILSWWFYPWFFHPEELDCPKLFRLRTWYHLVRSLSSRSEETV